MRDDGEMERRCSERIARGIVGGDNCPGRVEITMRRCEEHGDDGDDDSTLIRWG